MEDKELGAASISIELSNSIITVKHGQTGEVLRSIKARYGDWNKIWNTLDFMETK